jgi:cytochrome b6-f complex iron-sulfur subunit
MSEMNRREFVAAVACAAGACMMCGSFAGAADAVADAGAAASGAKIDAGAVTDYAKDGVFDKLASTKKILIARENGKIFAMTAVCPHKGSIVKLSSNGQMLECPKHHSQFKFDGEVTKGPARAALFRLGISQNADGHILVDPNKKFGEKQWDDDGASIVVK